MLNRRRQFQVTAERICQLHLPRRAAFSLKKQRRGNQNIDAFGARCCDVETVRAVIQEDQATDKSSLSIPVAKRQFDGVTGVSKQENSADIEFEWRWVPLNEIGEALYSRDLRYKSTVGFRKYDDGWRIVESALHPGQTMDEALKNAESIP